MIIGELKIKKTVSLSIAIFFIFFIKFAFSEMTVTYRSPESVNDIRREYNRALLELALQKTTAKYGPYKLIPSIRMNAARSLIAVKNGELENFFIKLSVSKKLLGELGSVTFPVDRGIVGYRVFFVSPNARNRLKDVGTIENLKDFTIGQGIGWLDTKILEYNGFEVITGTSYEGLFNMVAVGRFDLFPRGANELYGELVSHKNIKGLIYDDSIALYYPLPRFFFTAKKNIVARKRIEEGLIAAYNDGSFIKLWEKFYNPSINFVNLKNRKIFKIDNPFLKSIDNSYERYIYKP